MKKKIAIILGSLFLIPHFIFCSQTMVQNPLYFCTATNDRFFNALLNLIGSIHKVNFNDLNQIAVFDLGLTKDQRCTLQRIAKVAVYDVEQTHPDLLKLVEVRKGKWAPGYYAWKPVVIKQALDMFPYILYIDSRAIVLRPLNNLFKHIQQNGCFLLTCSHSIRLMTTQYVIKKFNLEDPDFCWILDESTDGLSAGLQGLSKVLYTSYVKPMYELSKDLRNFIDDGTTPNGYGTGRQDQPLFSVLARILQLPIHNKKTQLMIDNKTVPFSITFGQPKDKKPSILLQPKKQSDYSSFIRYK